MLDYYSLIDPYLFLITLIFCYLILEELGWFTRIAYNLIPLAEGNGYWLLVILGIIGGIMTLAFGNSGSILLWTPIVIKTLKLINFSPKKILLYLIATGLMADVFSPFLPWSNPINYLTITGLNINPGRYILVMLPLIWIIVLSSMAIFGLCFYPYIPPRYLQTIPKQNLFIISDSLYYGGLWVLSSVMISQWFNFSWGLMVTWLGLILLTILQRWHQPKSKFILFNREVIKRFPLFSIIYSIVLLIVSLMLMVKITEINQLLSLFFNFITNWGLTFTTIITGFLGMILSSLTHNMPTMINFLNALQQTTINDNLLQQGIIYGSIIGSTLGAKLTPIGSISTLIWLKILKNHNLKLNLSQYIRIHSIIIIPLLFISLLSLTVWLPWL
jgi:arsenical pump membrane protein